MVSSYQFPRSETFSKPAAACCQLPGASAAMSALEGPRRLPPLRSARLGRRRSLAPAQSAREPSRRRRPTFASGAVTRQHSLGAAARPTRSSGSSAPPSGGLAPAPPGAAPAAGCDTHGEPPLPALLPATRAWRETHTALKLDSSTFGAGLCSPQLRTPPRLRADTPAARTERSCSSSVLETSRLFKSEDGDGQKVINGYVYDHELGRGAFGKVKLAQHTETGRWYAMKVMSRRKLSKTRVCGQGCTQLDRVTREIEVMKQLEHPNLVRLREVINDPDCDKIYLVMDLAGGGPVWCADERSSSGRGSDPDKGSEDGEESGQAERDRRLPVDTIRGYLTGVCRGLEYMHDMNVLHRDLKPDNMLVDDSGSARLVDFGCSCPRSTAEDGSDDFVRDSEGTPAFLSPEQLSSEPIPGTMVDLWALGVSLYCMACGTLPFAGSSHTKLRDSVLGSEPRLDACPDPDLRDLIAGLLHKDLRQRIGFRGGVREVLRHPFLLRNAASESAQACRVTQP
eukprot:TRINITY_DN70591_c0_g1_i1.p1 TRINITY_DN70591_c0_g1~~TRINITY_DN70591_c0_g1_i1.p1  ORF type:complete len:511 (+),score=111.08 TRINITY_DN70591_c0_g1_i1:81-1613(+)